jgi:hypothetical protein
MAVRYGQKVNITMLRNCNLCAIAPFAIFLLNPAVSLAASYENGGISQLLPGTKISFHVNGTINAGATGIDLRTNDIKNPATPDEQLRKFADDINYGCALSVPTAAYDRTLDADISVDVIEATDDSPSNLLGHYLLNGQPTTGISISMGKWTTIADLVGCIQGIGGTVEFPTNPPTVPYGSNPSAISGDKALSNLPDGTQISFEWKGSIGDGVIVAGYASSQCDLALPNLPASKSPMVDIHVTAIMNSQNVTVAAEGAEVEITNLTIDGLPNKKWLKTATLICTDDSLRNFIPLAVFEEMLRPLGGKISLPQ